MVFISYSSSNFAILLKGKLRWQPFLILWVISSTKKEEIAQVDKTKGVAEAMQIAKTSRGMVEKLIPNPILVGAAGNLVEEEIVNILFWLCFFSK